MRRNPLVVMAAVAAAAELGWTAVNLAGPVGPAWVGSAPLFVAGALATAAAFRAWRAPGTTAVAARFWRLMTASFGLTLIVTVSDLPQYLRGPVTAPGPLALAGLVLSTMLTLVALYRLPLGARSVGERFRLLLDAATVTIATVVFAWYLSFGHGRSALSAHLVVASVVFCATHALTVFGLVRVLMSECRDVPPAALRVFTAGVAVSTLSILAIPLLAGHEPVGAEPVGRAVAYGLFVVAAVLQRRAVAGPLDSNRARRRPFSVAPYIAVASVDALLLATIAGDGMRVVVAAAAVTLTGLVIVRQLVAFRDNARLLGELARQERRFRSLVQNAADAIIILDEQGRATYASPGIETLTGFPATHWLGRQAFTVHPDDLADVVEKFGTVGAAPGRTVHYESRIANGAQEWQWVRVTLTNRLDDPAVGGIVANVSDVNETRAFQDQLAHQATHDPLTDLANRSLLLDRLSRTAGPVSLALVDLDDFKSVNDTMGHPAGDALLVTVASRLRDCVRATDLVARLGGDEFAILFHGDAPVAERALAALSRPLVIEGHELFVRASIGVAAAEPGDDVDTVMRAADVALYRAKAAGKGRVAHHAPGMTPAADARAGLYRALTRGELVLHYRPIVGLSALGAGPADGPVVGMEAFPRWNHPTDGAVPLVPLAEETGLIVPIGRWMLLEACREAAGWPGVSVTVSPRQLRDTDLVADVRDALVATGLPPHRLTIGIAGFDVPGTDRARAVARDLRAMGVRIALDDVGDSSLSLLTDLPVDELRLDRSVLTDPLRRPLAVAVIGVAQALGLTVVTDDSAPVTTELAVAASGAT